MGLFALIDEESRFPQATDITLVEKMAANSKNPKYFTKSKTSDLAFSIDHYAATVSTLYHCCTFSLIALLMSVTVILRRCLTITRRYHFQIACDSSLQLLPFVTIHNFSFLVDGRDNREKAKQLHTFCFKITFEHSIVNTRLGLLRCEIKYSGRNGLLYVTL